MNKDNLDKVANADAEALKSGHTPTIGGAINLVMDYGSGRQVTISATYPLDAKKEDLDKILDMLRLATNRQSAAVIVRDARGGLVSARKVVEAIELMLSEYEKDMNVEIERMSKEAGTKTIPQQQVKNMQQQAAQWKATKRQELAQAKGDVARFEAVIAHYEKEAEG